MSEQPTKSRLPAGQYVDLSAGRTHYRIDGEDQSRPLVLVHGATVPSWQFDSLVPLLVAAGFRCLRLDLYGHGRSARPNRPHTIDLFAEQTFELIEAVRFTHPFTLVGHSMGSAISATVASQRPNLCDRIVLIAPLVHFSLEHRWMLGLQLPLVGPALMRGFVYPRLVRRRMRRYRLLGREDLAERYGQETRYDVLGKALLSMFRCGALEDNLERYGRLEGKGIRPLLIAALRDAVIPAQDVASVRELLPEHDYVEFQAEHNLVLTHAAEIARAIDRFAS